MQAYESFMSEASAPPFSLINGLPKYSWDHENEYWHESRYARAERSRSTRVHQLLGHVTPDSTEENTRWRNILRSKGIPWMKGHRLQEQVVFPASGYVVLALEASLQICDGAPVSLIEILDIEIGKALTFDEDNANVEAVFSLINISRSGVKTIEANFTYNAAEKTGDSLALRASGRVRILLGEHLTTALPPRGSQPSGLLEVQSEDFYGSLEDMNYGYSGPFKALTDLQRRLGYSTGLISNLEPTTMVLHPAILDAAFQSTFLARSVPYDGGIWALHVPKTIRSVRINPVLCASEAAKGKTLLFDSVQPVNSSRFEGDVDIYSTSFEHSIVQIQGLTCVPFAAQSAVDDKEPFSTTVWGVAKPDAEKVTRDFVVTKDQRALSYLLERASIFYFRNLDSRVPRNHPARLNGSLSHLFTYASQCISLAESGKWSFWKPDWNRDTYQQIALACEPYADVIDIKLLRAIGDDLVAIATGEKQAIEVGMNSRKVDPRIISKTLLRLRATTVWQSEGVHESLLTSFEPEIMIDRKNQASIPRLILSQEMNNRYNSLRRPVFTKANENNQSISIHCTEAGHSVRKQSPLASIDQIGCLDVTHSLLSTVKVAESGYMFLMLAQDRSSDDQVLALSSELVSAFNPWEKFTIPIEIEPGLEADFLSHVTHHILASVISSGLTKGDRVLIFNASPDFDAVITWRARNIGVYVTFITYDTTLKGPNWLNIHPNAAERGIRDVLPAGTSVFVDLSEPYGDHTGSDRILSQLPNYCRSESLATLFRTESQIPWTSHSGEIKGRVQDAVNYAHYSMAETEVDRLDVAVVGVSTLAQGKAELTPRSIIDWTIRTEVPIKVQPINSGMLFQNSKTYWLAGLSHGLGLSLAEWMVRHGAKNIVISSRRPNIEQDWLKKMAASGITIQVYSCGQGDHRRVGDSYGRYSGRC